MSERSARQKKNSIDEPFPGMPDKLGKQPLKASDEAWKARTLDEAIERTYELLDRVIVQFSTGNAISTQKRMVRNPDYRPTAPDEPEIPKKIEREITVNYGPRELLGLFTLYSGGRDSVNTVHVVRRYLRDRPQFAHFFQGVVHVNTGTAIQATTDHVREAIQAWDMKLHELRPRADYLDLVLGNVLSTTGENIGRPVWIGFPGPGGDSHQVMYRRLKDEPLQRLRASLVKSNGTRRKVMFIGGMRWAESDKRFRTANEVDVDGGIVWVSPVVHWTNDHMKEYRDRHRCQRVHKHQPHRMCDDDALPVNEVTEHLHMSGDCACGAFAKPGEKDERAFFYPEHGKEIDRWEKAARDAGIPACRWGQEPPKGFKQTPDGNQAGGKSVIERLCAACAPQLPGQTDLLDTWRDSGLISLAQYDALKSA